MNTTGMHVDENAELYALGSLSDSERAAVDAHVATCASCAQRVGEAEEIVAALSARELAVPAQLDRRMRATFAPRSLPRSFYSLVAAALILGLLPSALLWQRDRDLSSIDGTRQQAASAMVHSHFLHAPFTSMAPGAPAAKAIFARTGAWLYVIATTNQDYTVVVNSGGTRRDLGVLKGTGTERELFVANPPRVKEVYLFDGARAVARATIATR
ncbi:MAG TPA: zf-HC2 domain-containing protein [Candidatus Rubrimentiphilum sp.]|nr:zf-HC2 domain-containing protein [Candidatus Rubrimentiphilum sp.]